jgi:hypothetical protein
MEKPNNINWYSTSNRSVPPWYNTNNWGTLAWNHFLTVSILKLFCKVICFIYRLISVSIHQFHCLFDDQFKSNWLLLNRRWYFLQSQILVEIIYCIFSFILFSGFNFLIECPIYNSIISSGIKLWSSKAFSTYCISEIVQ